MRLVNCEHPVNLLLKGSNRLIQVPCGRCNVCRNKRSSGWIGRLNEESSCWPYVVFFTLSYDDQYVPKLHLNDDYSLSDPWSGIHIDKDFVLGLSAKDRAYVRKRKGVTYGSVVDCQKFFKRLRYHFKQTCKSYYDENKILHGSESSVLRYFLVSEYGPTGHRVHYHGLLFFKSSRCFAEIEKLIGQSWKFGIIDAQPVRSSASSYVAGYLNSVVCLPKVFEHKLLRPFHLFSKCPPLGSLKILDSQVKEIFVKGITHLRTARGLQYVDVPMYQFIKNRLFPKISGFNLLSHNARIGLYGTAKFLGTTSFEEFKEWYDDNIFDNEKFRCPKEFVKDSVHHYLYSLYSPLNKKDPYSTLRRFWNIVCRVYYQSEIFGISIRNYVEHIEKYYDNVSSDQLRHYFSQQQTESVKYGNVRHWIYTDFIFVSAFLNTSWKRMPLEYIEIVRSFGVDAYLFYHSHEYRASINPYRYAEFKKFFSIVMDKVNSDHKTKERKEYLQRHPECRIV